MAKKLSFFLNACVFSLNACVGLVMHRQSLLLLLQVDMGGGTFFKLGAAQVHVKKLWNIFVV